MIEMTKYNQDLFNEMKTDFIEDLAIAYSDHAEQFNLSPYLPEKLFNSAIEQVTTVFAKLCAVHPRQFKETLFRVAVTSIAIVPTLAVVDERYAFALALSAVAMEYNPKRPTPSAQLQAVA